MFPRRNPFIDNFYMMLFTLALIFGFCKSSEIKSIVLCVFSYFYIKQYGVMACSALAAAFIASLFSGDISKALNTATIWFVAALAIFHYLFIVLIVSSLN